MGCILKLKTRWTSFIGLDLGKQISCFIGQLLILSRYCFGKFFCEARFSCCLGTENSNAVVWTQDLMTPWIYFCEGLNYDPHNLKLISRKEHILEMWLKLWDSAFEFGWTIWWRRVSGRFESTSFSRALVFFCLAYAISSQPSCDFSPFFSGCSEITFSSQTVFKRTLSLLSLPFFCFISLKAVSSI